MECKRDKARKYVNGYVIAGTTIVVLAIVPGSTTAVLIGIEAKMCYDIGKIYRGENYRFEDAVKAAGAIGLAAFTGKIIALEAMNLIPGAGHVAKAGIAGTVIKVLGEAIIAFYESTETSSVLAITASTVQESLLPPLGTRTKSPAKNIVFIGATGTGKSSTINALLNKQFCEVGVEHGTTTAADTAKYLDDYQLQDSPGLLDQDKLYINLIWDVIRDSELVVYTVTGQLFRQELEFVEHIYNCQREWDQQSNTVGYSQIALYVNKEDIKESTMPSIIRTEEANLIKSQVANWIPPERIVFGAARPVINGEEQPPRIDELRDFLNQHINKERG